MQMWNFLTSMFSVINDNSIPFIKFLELSNLSNSHHQLPQDSLMPVLGIADSNQSILLLRNDEDMHWSLWIDIPESKNIIGLIHNTGGYLFADDFVEYSLALHILRYII